MGGAGAAGGGVSAEGQDATTGPATHDRGDPLEAPEWGQVVCGSHGARSLVAGGSDLIRWARLGVWERLLRLVQEQGVKLGMAFLDGTSIRAHQKAAGAARKGDLQRSEIAVKHLAALVGATAPRLA
jgi:hypothetical protein